MKLDVSDPFLYLCISCVICGVSVLLFQRWGWCGVAVWAAMVAAMMMAGGIRHSKE